MVSNSIRIGSSLFSQEELVQKIKNNYFPKSNPKFIDFQIQKGSIPILKGSLNAQKFYRKFSDEQIKRINTNRKLPNGYLLGYTPQKIIHHYLQGCYNGATIIPPTYNLIKTDRISTAKKKYPQILKKIPEGFKVLNTNDGTYIAGKDVTKEQLNKYFNSALGKIKTGIRKFFKLK